MNNHNEKSPTRLTNADFKAISQMAIRLAAIYLAPRRSSSAVSTLMERDHMPRRSAFPVAAILLALVSPAAAEVHGPLPDGNPEALRLIEAAAAECAAEEAGALVINDGAYVAQDLDADGDDDLVLDFDHIHCQYSMAQWAGTGGTPKWFILDGFGSIEIWGGAWTIVDIPPTRTSPKNSAA
jgi:hypothetical protein